MASNINKKSANDTLSTVCVSITFLLHCNQTFRKGRLTVKQGGKSSPSVFLRKKTFTVNIFLVHDDGLVRNQNNYICNYTAIFFSSNKVRNFPRNTVLLI